jgi:hypothetical protein
VGNGSCTTRPGFSAFTSSHPGHNQLHPDIGASKASLSSSAGNPLELRFRVSIPVFVKFFSIISIPRLSLPENDRKCALNRLLTLGRAIASAVSAGG